jgi:hypothetical protein
MKDFLTHRQAMDTELGDMEPAEKVIIV